MANIKFTPEALNDLQEIKSYISDELGNVQSANKAVSQIIDRIRQLQQFPELGASLSSIVDVAVPYRFLLCGNYNAFYKVNGTEVFIIRVLYGRRNFMRILFDK